LHLPITDASLEADLPPYYHPGMESEEIQYMLERRRALGGSLPARINRAKPVKLPGDAVYAELRQGSGKQKVATTMGFVRLLKDLMKEDGLGVRIVPIIPDEARTFGMDSLFPTAKIYSPHGQQYDAVDRDLVLSYKESKTGQLLHEGITEAGAMGSFIAAGSAYATHGQYMVPVYIFYSMFGFQRTGDQIWAAADQMCRGFLLGATAGRTTLTGEGLQHNDGQSPLLASTNPAVVYYDPAFAYEIGHVVHSGLQRMFGSDDAHPAGEDIFYYITIYNEPILQPAQPDNLDVEGLLAGLYHLAGPSPSVLEAPRAQLLASGVAVPWALEAQRLLAEDWNVGADVWSATSWTELRRDALACDTFNLLHPDADQRVPYVTRKLAGRAGPVVAVSDYMRAVPDQIARWVPADYASLGTDGFGFSDTRAATRRFFHVDAPSIVLQTLRELARRGEIATDAPGKAAAQYGLL
jgi:pyruvate dehydrogenase E1 component